MPEDFGGHAFKDMTNLHPLALIAVLVLGIIMLAVPRRWAILPMLIIACFISTVQKIVIVGMDFGLLRIMVMFGITRLILRKESHGFVWKPLDLAICLWAISSIVIYTLQQGTVSALVNRLGFGFDAFGMYFLFRCLIRDWSDVDTVVISLIMISIPVALFFILENRTGRNLFSIFGGVPAITVVRDGRLRCQGAFSHPILAGCFWASLMPWFAARWWKSSKDKIWALAGLVTASITIICCSSSTPLFGVLSGMVGGLMFFARRYMRPIRWGILFTLLALHMVMNAPVWHLISRVTAVGGSTSYFRYALINGAINHFREWALLGTQSTAHWFWGAQDLCNQYVFEGVQGGFLTLVFFVYGIVLAFGGVGKLWRQNRDPYRIALSWALGVSLYVHCMNFIGVSYFGQIHVIWYLLLAMIASMAPGGQADSIVRSVPRQSIRTMQIHSPLSR